jgi:ribonucleoside-diphosphate reductase alpha chain
VENTRKIYEYAEAKKLCLEYFKGEELSATVFLDKYALKDRDQNLLEATPDEMFDRL